MKLRVDPWDPEYGASVALEPDLEEAVGLDLKAEVTGPWRPIAAATIKGSPCCAFVDGVRRIDARLFAEESDVEAPGLAGSWAVGCAWSTNPPRVRDIRVGRELVIGGGIAGEAIEFQVGGTDVIFEPRSVAGTAPLDPLRGLQNAMRDAEAELARQTIKGEGADLVVSDGPLSYFDPGPAIGLIKRQSRSYLDAERSAILAEMAPGERTPIFRLGEQRLVRYSWYLRLTDRRAIDGPMAGVVRLEVSVGSGLDGAQELARLAGFCLPRFASQPGRDPRAPQNLYPVGALEMQLRNRLGDANLIRRALELELLEAVVNG